MPLIPTTVRTANEYGQREDQRPLCGQEPDPSFATFVVQKLQEAKYDTDMTTGERAERIRWIHVALDRAMPVLTREDVSDDYEKIFVVFLYGRIYQLRKSTTLGTAEKEDINDESSTSRKLLRPYSRRHILTGNAIPQVTHIIPLPAIHNSSTWKPIKVLASAKAH